MRLLILTILSLALISAQTKEPKRTEIEAKVLADSLYEKLTNGADFTSLAKHYSEDPGTKEKGGMIDPFKEGSLNIEFENVVVNLKLKEISRPFKSPYGYHIAQLLDINRDLNINREYYTVRHILIKFQH